MVTWARQGAFIGVVAAVVWLPSWTFSGIVAPFGLICIGVGWKSEPRRWVCWLGLVVNAVLLIGTAVVWLTS
jgi:hypothetical protein